MKRFVPIVLAFIFVLVTTLGFAAEWTGTIMKSPDGKLWFKVGDKTFSITNPAKAEGQEGKTVKVTGTTDEAAQSVTIDSVAPATE